MNHLTASVSSLGRPPRPYSYMRPSAGVILYYSRDPLHIAVGDQLLAIITDAGWQATEFQKTLPSGPGEQMDFDHCMLMLFIVPETEQLSNPREVINEFFGLCGFSPVSVRIPAIVNSDSTRW